MTETNDEKHQDDESGSLEEHRRRMRFQWNDLMEDLIEDGRRRGLFEDLPGKGKPLDLDKNIYEGSNTLANQIMKANDIKPVWLAQRISVSERIEELRAEMARTWDRYSAAFTYAHGESHRQALTIGWDDQCQRWQSTIERLNKEIETYNLKRPRGQTELLKLRLLDELKRIDAPRYLL
jgi:hypothetical protein